MTINHHDGIAHLVEQNRTVATPFFNSCKGQASLCPLERHLFSFSHLGVKNLPVMVAQPDIRYANKTVLM